MARFAILHEGWLTHCETSADEIAVLTVLALHASRNGTCFPTQGLLASLLGRSRPWVVKVLNKLVEIGLVERTHRIRSDGGDRSCLYRLVPPADAKTSPDSPPVEKDISKYNVDSIEYMACQQHDTGCHTVDTVTPDQEHNNRTLTASASDILPSSFVPQFPPLIIPPDDFQPSDSDILWAITAHPDADLQAHTERFVNRCQAKGYRFRPEGIGRAWRSWLTDDTARAKAVVPRSGGSSRTTAAHVKFEAWAGVAARYSMGGARHAA